MFIKTLDDGTLDRVFYVECDFGHASILRYTDTDYADCIEDITRTFECDKCVSVDDDANVADREATLSAIKDKLDRSQFTAMFAHPDGTVVAIVELGTSYAVYIKQYGLEHFFIWLEHEAAKENFDYLVRIHRVAVNIDCES